MNNDVPPTVPLAAVSRLTGFLIAEIQRLGELILIDKTDRHIIQAAELVAAAKSEIDQALASERAW